MESVSTAAERNSEDSSGSDNISLLSAGVPATETDRFGFILGTGSTVGTEGPPPEVVRQRETKWLNIISQWDRILLKKTNKVKDQCRKGIPASLRARCWPLLCRAVERMNQNRKLYQTLDTSPGLQSWVDVIERDIDRQFPFHEMFLSRDGHGQQGLFRVLKAYTQFRPDEGYCQGQGPVAAVLLMNMPAEEAFWCLVQISEQYLPGYYSPLLEGVLFDAGVLSGVLRRACPAAHRHLLKHGVEPLMFATDWLMCLYTRHLPFHTLLRVWDLFFCYGVRVLFQVAVVLVRRTLGRQEQREECEGQMETLERLRGVKAQVLQEDDAFIEEVCSVPLSSRDLEREMEKEMGRWRKERPSSTFDPRRRCHGYRVAWCRTSETPSDAVQTPAGVSHGAAGTDEPQTQLAEISPEQAEEDNSGKNAANQKRQGSKRLGRLSGQDGVAPTPATPGVVLQDGPHSERSPHGRSADSGPHRGGTPELEQSSGPAQTQVPANHSPTGGPVLKSAGEGQGEGPEEEADPAVSEKGLLPSPSCREGADRTVLPPGGAVEEQGSGAAEGGREGSPQTPPRIAENHGRRT
ncbi:hypothetical protein AAFF_G00299180 [Aldrovandia affinis]|uniref:Rab-GAP TBC domain-containing protein n=1 Tax=Aldrovandia affinis TaxID=143900 RepID=A0AAD7R959_9TELE|nr:hypothetical protein AAFF_G00299180 [Aldrovandia affinis]